MTKFLWVWIPANVVVLGVLLVIAVSAFAQADRNEQRIEALERQHSSESFLKEQ